MADVLVYCPRFSPHTPPTSTPIRHYLKKWHYIVSKKDNHFIFAVAKYCFGTYATLANRNGRSSHRASTRVPIKGSCLTWWLAVRTTTRYVQCPWIDRSCCGTLKKERPNTIWLPWVVLLTVYSSRQLIQVWVKWVSWMWREKLL